MNIIMIHLALIYLSSLFIIFILPLSYDPYENMDEYDWNPLLSKKRKIS